jgi:hypothetical protein
MKDILKYEKYPIKIWVCWVGFIFSGILIFYSFACAMALDDGATSNSLIVHLLAKSYHFWFKSLVLDYLFPNKIIILFVGLFVKACIFSLVFERITIPARFVYRYYNNHKRISQ